MGQYYIYFALQPNSLIASSLDPIQFGVYMTGNKERHATGQQKIYFELDAETIFMSGKFNTEGLDEVFEKKPKKKSEYICTDDVLEKLDIFAFKSLYLATKSGKVLEIEEEPYSVKAKDFGSLYLYMQLAPQISLIASRFSPLIHLTAFTNEPIKRFSFPRMILVDLRLNGLADDPMGADIKGLPYESPKNLRACLQDLNESSPSKMTKGIDGKTGDIHWRLIEGGFLLGSGDESIYYPFPTIEKLENELYENWWRYAKSE